MRLTKRAEPRSNVVELSSQKLGYLDWLAAGAVTRMQQEGDWICHSCWAFAATCAVEEAHFIKAG